MHISNVTPECRVASTLSAAPLDTDDYHKTIKRHAWILYTLGMAAYRYVTQYQSGATVWQLSQSRKVLVNSDGIVIAQ